MAEVDVHIRNLWQCSGCSVLFLGNVGKCNGECHNAGSPACDALPCPGCRRLHYWTGSINRARGLRALGWSFDQTLESWAHQAYDGRFSETAAMLVQLGFAHGRPAGSPPRPPAALVELDADTRDALARLLRTSRRNDPTVEVDTTDLALVVEHLADAAGLDTDDL
jgi:hypothetical protein